MKSQKRMTEEVSLQTTSKDSQRLSLTVVPLYVHPSTNSFPICMKFGSLSFPVGGMGHSPNPPQEAPQASWVALVVEVGPQLPPRLVSVGPDVLPSHQHHCNVDKWRSLDVGYGADRPPQWRIASAQLCHRASMMHWSLAQSRGQQWCGYSMPWNLACR